VNLYRAYRQIHLQCAAYICEPPRHRWRRGG